MPYQLQYILHFGADGIVVFTPVGAQAAGTVLDTIFGIAEASPAVFPQAIKWTITEETAECLRISARMAGKITALFVLKKLMMKILLHDSSSRLLYETPPSAFSVLAISISCLREDTPSLPYRLRL